MALHPSNDMKLCSTKMCAPTPIKKRLTIRGRSKVTTRGYLRKTGEFKSNSTGLSPCSYKDFEDTPVKLHISYFIKTSE